MPQEGSKASRRGGASHVEVDIGRKARIGKGNHLRYGKYPGSLKEGFGESFAGKDELDSSRKGGIMRYRDADGVDYPAECWCGLRADIRVFADDGGMIGAVCSYHIPESAGPIYDDENVEEA